MALGDLCGACFEMPDGRCRCVSLELGGRVEGLPPAPSFTPPQVVELGLDPSDFRSDYDPDVDGYIWDIPEP